MRILIDTREQTPLDFSRFADVEVLPATLTTGDYSAEGLQNLMALERKSLTDLVACIGPGRERFERELLRGKGLEYFGVVIEADMAAVASHAYRSRTIPASVMQSVLTSPSATGLISCGAGPGTWSPTSSIPCSRNSPGRPRRGMRPF